MATWDRNKACAALDTMALAETNRDVADYWLSLWTADGPPTRQRFEPKRLPKHLPALAIFEVMPDGRVLCHLAGTYIHAVLGHDLTEHDLLEFTPAGSREARHRLASEIADGAIAHDLRHFTKLNGTEFTAGEICLPFAGRTEHGGRRYLFHSAWRPELLDRRFVGVAPPRPSHSSAHQLLSIQVWVVLVVDDETFIRMDLCSFLETNGFGVQGASNGKDAQDVLKRQTPLIDLVLSDVQMPGEMDGVGLAVWIRDCRPELPVILCSGKRPQNIPEGVSFIQKPYELADVLNRVCRAVAS